MVPARWRKFLKTLTPNSPIVLLDNLYPLFRHTITLESKINESMRHRTICICNIKPNGRQTSLVMFRALNHYAQYKCGTLEPLEISFWDTNDPFSAEISKEAGKQSYCYRRKFCGIYFCNFYPYSQKFIPQKIFKINQSRQNYQNNMNPCITSNVPLTLVVITMTNHVNFQKDTCPSFSKSNLLLNINIYVLRQV